MRYVYKLMYVGVIAVILAVVLSVLGYALYNYYVNMKSASQNITDSLAENLNTTPQNISNYDIVPRLNPIIIVVDIAVIVAFIFSIVGIFLYSKRR